MRCLNMTIFLTQETRRYKELIKTPMDLSIVKRKLESKLGDSDCYSSPEGLVTDVRLIFFNCAKYYKVNIWFCNIYIYIYVFLSCLTFHNDCHCSLVLTNIVWLIFLDLTVQATSEVGSAGLYLEDYFEEQLKQAYPDRIFPGGREEQMIPPLEDEIDEEEEGMMQEGTAPLEDDKPQSPAEKGIPPVEEDFPLEEATAATEEEKPEIQNGINVSDKEANIMVTQVDVHPCPAEEAEQGEQTEQQPKTSVAAADETKDGAAPSIIKEEKLSLSTDKAADPPQEQEEDSAPSAEATKEG